MEQEQLREMIATILADMRLDQSLSDEIPVEVSGRHVHFSGEDFRALFGAGAELDKLRDVSQPGQFVSNHRVRLIGPKGTLDRVAVLGPLRPRTQVEVSATDAVALGITAPVRLSGKLDGSADLHIQAGAQVLRVPQCAIVAARHLHMTPADAGRFGVADGQLVDVLLQGTRPLVLREVAVRADDNSALGLHIDRDEANAAGMGNGGFCRIVRGAPELSPKADSAGAGAKGTLDLPPEERGPALITEALVLEAARDGCGTIRTTGKALLTPSAQDALRAHGIEWIRG